MAQNNAPDLTKQPPRSARVRLGGYVILARMLDKGRATLAGKNGEYNYALNPFKDVAVALFQPPAPFSGLQDRCRQIRGTAKNKRTDPEIAAWSDFAERRVPTDAESRSFFNELQQKSAPSREDIATWFELLDVDDYVSFGGKA